MLFTESLSFGREGLLSHPGWWKIIKQKFYGRTISAQHADVFEEKQSTTFSEKNSLKNCFFPAFITELFKLPVQVS